MVATKQELGSFPLLAQQAENLLHFHLYCRCVDGSSVLAMVSLTGQCIPLIVGWVLQRPNPELKTTGVGVPNWACQL